MANSDAGAASPSPSTVRKVALAACTATSIEWYDFFIYLPKSGSGKIIWRVLQEREQEKIAEVK